MFANTGMNEYAVHTIMHQYARTHGIIAAFSAALQAGAASVLTRHSKLAFAGSPSPSLQSDVGRHVTSGIQWKLNNQTRFVADALAPRA